MAGQSDRAARRRWLESLLAPDDPGQRLAERAEEWIELAWPMPQQCGGRGELARHRPCEPESSLQTRVSWRDGRGRLRRRRLRCVTANRSLHRGECELRFLPGAPDGMGELLTLERLLRSSLAGRPSGSVQALLDLAAGPEDAVEAGSALRACRERLDEPELVLADAAVVPGDAGGPEAPGARRAEREARSAVSLAARVLRNEGRGLEGLRCVVSGSGAGGLAAACALSARGASVVALGDAGGVVLPEEEFDLPQLEALRRWRLTRGRALSELAARRRSLRHRPRAVVSSLPCEAIFSFDGRGDLGAAEAHRLAGQGLRLACEGTPLSFTQEACVVLREQQKVAFLPSFLATAGAALVTGGERADEDLEERVAAIHDRSRELAAGARLEIGAARAAWRNLTGAMRGGSGG